MTKEALDYEAVKNTYMVTVTATDAGGEMDEVAVTVTVTNVNEPGAVSLSEMQPVVGTELTATLMDADVVVAASLTWQWASSGEMGGTYADIEEATMASYTPVDGDVGMYLRATAMYNDGHGESKSAMMESANAVTAADTLLDRYDANDNDMIDKPEVLKAINDYLFGEGDEAISKPEVLRLINLYLFG